MWYKNIAGRFFGLVTKNVCDRQTDRQTDRITTPKTTLAQLRRVVIIIIRVQYLCILRMHLFLSYTMEANSGYSVYTTRSPAIAEGPRDAGVPVEIW